MFLPIHTHRIPSRISAAIFIPDFFPQKTCAELTTEPANSLTQKKIIDQLTIVNKPIITNFKSAHYKTSILLSDKPGVKIVNIFNVKMYQIPHDSKRVAYPFNYPIPLLTFYPITLLTIYPINIFTLSLAAQNKHTLSALLYYIALPFLYIISLLPFPVLYLLSDFMYVVLYRMLGYRKQVVLTNMRNSFPDKTDDEINQLAKKYYHYLCDLTLETFKTLTISKKTMVKRCRFTDEALQTFNQLAAKNQSIILVMGHLGNWEWAGNSFSLLCKHHLYVIYHPLSNRHFDGLMYRMRSRFGTGLIPMKDTFRQMLANRNELTATAFIADQSPPKEGAHWMTFLNQETPVFKGTELIARKINYPIVYGSIKRVKRGYYEVSVEVLIEQPKDTIEGGITETHTRRLEQDIIAQPETWIWSHRRWKHKKG